MFLLLFIRCFQWLFFPCSYKKRKIFWSEIRVFANNHLFVNYETPFRWIYPEMRNCTSCSNPHTFGTTTSIMHDQKKIHQKCFKTLINNISRTLVGRMATQTASLCVAIMQFPCEVTVKGFFLFFYLFLGGGVGSVELDGEYVGVRKYAVAISSTWKIEWAQQPLVGWQRSLSCVLAATVLGGASLRFSLCMQLVWFL